MGGRWLYEVVEGDGEREGYLRLGATGRLHVYDGDVYEASWDLTGDQARALALALVRWADGR